MTKTIDNVVYYLNNGVYHVGNNNSKSGLSPTTYSGGITIQASIDGIDVTEISKKAFYMISSITNVTILANLKRINDLAFYYCSKLTYINIPSTVTYIGSNALNIGSSSTTIKTPITVEFNPGRKEAVTLKGYALNRRDHFDIIYPSSIPPICDSDAMKYINTADICAPEEFAFCTFTTTKNQTKCPEPLFHAISNERKTYFRHNTNSLDIFLKSFFVIFNNDQVKAIKPEPSGIIVSLKKFAKKVFRLK